MDISIDVRGDGGAATVLGLAVIASITTLLMVLLHVGAWSMARAQSAMVADIAALSAARHGSCEAARFAARIHDVELVDCFFEAGDAIVLVRPPIRLRSPFLPSVEGMSRAGF